MDSLKLYEKDIIDLVSEAHYNFFTSIKDTLGPHTHDFYEFFLVTQGKMKHIVNSTQQILADGNLIFIRPNDCHYYEIVENSNSSFINLAFSKRVIEALFDYLGESFPWEDFLTSPTPPTILLSKTDSEILKIKLEALNLIALDDKAGKRFELRTLLVELFTRYMLTNDKNNAKPIPIWLSNLLDEMKSKNNFTRGISAMTEISSKCHEYICREMKKHLNQTPTKFINELRLDYAANLILSTDKSVLSISLEAGFDNLSHFNHLFKEKYKVSPSTFRKLRYQKVVL